MNLLSKFSVWSAIMAVMMPMQAHAEIDISNQTSFTYLYEGATTDLFGIQRNVRTDVAMLLKNPALTGYKVVSVVVDVPTKEGCSVEPVGSAFLTTKLQVEGEDNVPDLQEVSGEIQNFGTADEPDMKLVLAFDEPYELTDEGVYVGYSLTVTSCKTVSGWTSKYPIVTVCDIDAPESFMIHCNKGQSTLPQKYAEWTDLNPEKRQALAMRVILEGETAATKSAILEPQQTLYVAPGTEGNAYMTLINDCDTEISNIEYTYLLPNGTRVTETAQLDQPIAGRVGASGVVDLAFTAPGEVGVYDIAVGVSRINGEETENYRTTDMTMEVVPFLPVNRPLIEDYTGLWCGYCPEVYVLCHQMADKYDDFLSMEYHCDDRVQGVSADNLPSDSYGMPKVYMGDRSRSIDYTNMETLWQKARRQLAPADLNVQLYWNDEEHTALRAESQLKFVYDDAEAEYMVTYALLEDDMSSPDWKQRNYFYDKDYSGPYWDLFCGKTFSESGIVYHGVIVSYPDTRGISGSLPSEIAGGEEYKHDTVLALADATCKYTGDQSLYGKNLIQNPDKLRVVALLIDGKTGNVCNAATTGYAADAPLYSDNTSVVDELPAIGGGEYIYSEYYTVEGVRLQSAPAKGLYIELQKMSDGSIHARKLSK